MSLRDLPLAYDYRSDQSNLVDEFYVPCLTESVGYWRAVGYFTSQGLALAAKGLSAFIRHGGRMRLVASPLLEPEDIEAFKRGYEAREQILQRAIWRQISDDILNDLSQLVRHRLECIAWLIAEERLDVKLAVPSPELLASGQAIYHEKMGLFLDSEGNVVAFTGSPNETVGGLVSNFESVDVYMSWDDPQGRVRRKIDNFERLWANLTPRLTVVEFPVAAKQQLLQLRPSVPPAIDPESGCPPTISVPALVTSSNPDLPLDVQLRPYQIDACRAWMEKGGRGQLVMATGSGKTMTALASAVQLLKEHGQLFIVVACPFQHLVDQWSAEAERFGFRPLQAYQSRHRWENTLNSRILDYNLGHRTHVTVVTTHATLCSQVMQASLSRVTGPSLLIADEVHHLGAEEGRRNLPREMKYRLGLSATPERWFDEEGTLALRDYFGEPVFEFSLKDAIAENCLSEYYYYPHLVELRPHELEEYEQLTRRIAQLFDSTMNPQQAQLLEALLRQRADILNRAENKLAVLSQLMRKKDNVHHTLFYCAPGQIDQVLRLLGNEFGLHVHRFTVEESAEERRRLLTDFASGRLQALVAIRCLDEGVDVPSTHVAYILASSSNPREFIQRRGRILRKAPGKEHAVIHDLITVPSLSYHAKAWSLEAFNVERKILKRELARFREFANASRNPFQATQVIWDIAKSYNLLDF